MITTQRQRFLGWLALFASTGTLICCALPIVLVTLGFGAAVAVLSGNFPFLVTLSLHKTWVFAVSGVLLALSGWVLFRSGQSCPPEPAADEVCQTITPWNKGIFWLSVTIWGLGFFAAYLALPLRIWLGV
jgi:hypothetical protein